MLKSIFESEIRDEFMKGERGGEAFYDLPNDYKPIDALRYFAINVVAGKEDISDDTKLTNWWYNRCTADRKRQFKKTYKKFESYRNGKRIILYRGIVIKPNIKIDFDKLGVCWSFDSKTAADWADDIWEKKVQDINANRTVISELDGCKKYVLTCTTTLDNCRLPYSFWLAGRFDGKEWEVRIKDEKKLKLISTEEIEFEE